MPVTETACGAWRHPSRNNHGSLKWSVIHADTDTDTDTHTHTHKQRDNELSLSTQMHGDNGVLNKLQAKMRRIIPGLTTSTFGRLCGRGLVFIDQTLDREMQNI